MIKLKFYNELFVLCQHGFFFKASNDIARLQTQLRLFFCLTACHWSINICLYLWSTRTCISWINLAAAAAAMLTVWPFQVGVWELWPALSGCVQPSSVHSTALAQLLKDQPPSSVLCLYSPSPNFSIACLYLLHSVCSSIKENSSPGSWCRGEVKEASHSEEEATALFHTVPHRVL